MLLKFLAICIPVLAAPAGPAAAQNIPDRIVAFNPLRIEVDSTAGFEWLSGIRLYAEFGRYTNPSGSNHRWNAKTGGYIDFVRWDSTASIAFTGTMEVVVDPQSDITFNPRAIFWEEGIIATFRLADDLHLQGGYMHRCKHDIDNLEIYYTSRREEQRVLIYSSITTRLMHRRTLTTPGSPIELSAHGAVRNDLFTHLLDDRWPAVHRGVGRSLETLANATNLSLRLDARRPGARYGLHLLSGLQLSLYGQEPGLTERFADLDIVPSVPFVELGFDLFNPRGAAFTIFARGEWQHDGGVAPEPLEASLLLFGIRTSDMMTMW